MSRADAGDAECMKWSMLIMQFALVSQWTEESMKVSEFLVDATLMT